MHQSIVIKIKIQFVKGGLLKQLRNMMLKSVSVGIDRNISIENGDINKAISYSLSLFSYTIYFSILFYI